MREIYNQELFRQKVLFKGINAYNEKETGTDVDWEFENGKTWIRCEIKEWGKPLTVGQEILMKRFVKSVSYQNVWCFLLWHTAKPNEDIVLANTIPALYINNKTSEWQPLTSPLNFYQVFNSIISYDESSLR